MLLFSEDARKRSWRIGYIPIPLPVWCWDPRGILSRAIPVLRERDTDKVL
jgi:hypothetical protein